MRRRRPHGRAEVDPSRPRAWATCQRCGILYNHENLDFDKQWAGNQLVKQRLLVCPECIDEPQPQLRTIILPADPEPIKEPRPNIYDGQND